MVENTDRKTRSHITRDSSKFKKNIVYILPNPYFSSEEKGQHFGGHVSHVVGIVKALNECGYLVTIVTARELPYTSNMVQYRCVDIAKKILKVPLIGRFFWDIKLVSQIVKVILKKSPDFVYARFVASSVAIPLLKLLSRNTKIILEINTPACLMVDERNPIHKLAANIVDLLNVSYSNVVSLVSNHLKEVMCKRYPKYASKYVVIYNGVDVNKFSYRDCVNQELRTKYGIKEDDFVIGFSGVFMKYHAIDVLIQSFSIVAQHRSDVHLLLIGDGDIKEELINLVKKLDISNKTIFTGFIPFADMPNYLSICDILVLPLPTRSHSSPIKLYEYMAMGKCVVVSDVGQHVEVIKDNYNGVVFKAGDVKCLSEKLSELVANKEKIQALGIQAREDAVKLHSWKKRVSDLLDFCKSKWGGVS